MHESNHKAIEMDSSDLLQYHISHHHEALHIPWILWTVDAGMKLQCHDALLVSAYCLAIPSSSFADLPAVLPVCFHSLPAQPSKPLLSALLTLLHYS